MIRNNRSEAAPNQVQQIGAVLQLLVAAVVSMSYILGAWAFTAYLGITHAFPWSAGPFSSWMVWVAVGVLLHMCVPRLQRQLSDSRDAIEAGFHRITDAMWHRLPRMEAFGFGRFIAEIKSQNRSLTARVSSSA